MEKKLLITDLDDTLYDWTGFFVPAFYAMVDEIVALTGLNRARLLHEYRETHQRLGTVEYPYATLKLPSIRRHFAQLDDVARKEALRPAFLRFNAIRDGSLRLFPGVEETLQTLRARGVPVIGYTESSQENGFYRLERLGVSGYFQHVYTYHSRFRSGYAPSDKVMTVQTRKPDTAVLLRICERERHAPGEVVYVGDSLVKDVYMGKMAGATAVWANYPRESNDYHEKLAAITSWTEEDMAREERLSRHLSEGAVRPDHVIHSFPEILPIVLGG